MRYLITGGAGFIGSHLAERLLEKGERVVLLDNLSTGSMENIRHLKSSHNLEYHLDAIENQHLLAELVDDADVIVHLDFLATAEHGFCAEDVVKLREDANTLGFEISFDVEEETV